MRVAICDDNEYFRNSMESFMEQLKKTDYPGLEWQVFECVVNHCKTHLFL